MVGGVAAAATGEVEQAGVGEVGHVVMHVRRLEIEAGGRERVGQAGIRVTGNVSGRALGKLLEMGSHEVGPKRAVEADRQRMRVGKGIPKGLDFLRGNHRFTTEPDRCGNDQRKMQFHFRINFLHGHRRGLGIERIKDRFDHQDVAAAFDQRLDLQFVSIEHLIKTHHAEARVIGIGRVGERNRERPDRTGDIALAAGVAANGIGPLAAELGRLNIHFPGELVEKRILDDLLEKFRILASAFFARILDEEFALRDAGGGEGVGLADVRARFIESLVDVAYDFRAGEAQNVAVVEQVLFAIGKALTAGIAFVEPVGADRRAHGAIEHQNPFGQGITKFPSGVGLNHAGIIASKAVISRIKSSYLDMMMGF